jgi:hypothetical protein
MESNISARGYTNVILVLNMKRFVNQCDQERFETLRGTREFAEVLRKNWPSAISGQDAFISLEEEKQRLAQQDGRIIISDERMATEQIGFATGIFRSVMIEEYTFPTYALDKEKIIFPDTLATNFQFKALFQRAWDRWHVYIRPSFTGFFTIRLTQYYRESPRSLLALAQDVLNLQESLDVRSAWRWRERARQQYKNDPELLAVKENSVDALLEWIGVTQEDPGELLYYPVQWKIAMEVAGLFVDRIGSLIPLPDQNPIKLTKPSAKLSIPLHDSYVIYHLDDLLANPLLVKHGDKKKEHPNVQVPITLNDIRAEDAHILRRTLVNLAEGSVLEKRDFNEKVSPFYTSQSNSSGAVSDNRKIVFPTPRWSLVDKFLEQNQASWNDELCILASRTAVIMPSKQWRDYDLAVSTVPSSTMKVKYSRYWSTIERMIEFIVEVRVLAQLLESSSYDLLEEIAKIVHQMREKLFTGNIKMYPHMRILAANAANVKRLAALCQSLSHPQLWSRTEYAIQKAQYLLDQLDVPKTLQHLERNIDSIASMVDHVDELYLADLSEKSNDKTTLLSLGVAAASLTLTLLMLPSFWVDMYQLNQEYISSVWEQGGSGFSLLFVSLGTLLAMILIFLAFILLRMAFIQRKYIRDIFKRFLNGE